MLLTSYVSTAPSFLAFIIQSIAEIIFCILIIQALKVQENKFQFINALNNVMIFNVFLFSGGICYLILISYFDLFGVFPFKEIFSFLFLLPRVYTFGIIFLQFGRRNNERYGTLMEKAGIILIVSNILLVLNWFLQDIIFAQPVVLYLFFVFLNFIIFFLNIISFVLLYYFGKRINNEFLEYAGILLILALLLAFLFPNILALIFSL